MHRNFFYIIKRMLSILVLFTSFQNCGTYLLLDDLFFTSNQNDTRTQFAEMVLTTMNVGLIHYWPLDGDANDRVGTLHLTPLGTIGPILTSDHNGLPRSAFQYDGIDALHQSSVVGDPVLAGNITSFTLSAWVKGKFPTTNTGASGIFVSQDAALGMQYYVDTSTGCSHRIRVYTSQGGSGAVDLLSDCGAYKDDVWYHVTFIWDMPANTGYLYVNNDLIYTHSFDPSFVPWSTGGPFALGFGAIGGLYFEGTIDEVRLYNRIVPPIFFTY